MSGVDLRYVASSGNIYNLRDGSLRTGADANFHDWAWEVIAVALQYGSRVSGFTRSPQEYEATLSLFGSEESKQKQLEAVISRIPPDMLQGIAAAEKKARKERSKGWER